MTPRTFANTAKGGPYSLRQCVEQREREFSTAIVNASPRLRQLVPVFIRWVSPLKKENYQEYGDDFLRPLGLSHHQCSLREFWPAGGPQWDGLASYRGGRECGALLVETQSYPGEAGPVSPESQRRIALRLEEVRTFMGAKPSNWMSGSYRLANRLAHLYFLNEICHVPAFLVLVSGKTLWAGTLGLQENCRLMDRIIAISPETL